jgi:hypothetical protein
MLVVLNSIRRTLSTGTSAFLQFPFLVQAMTTRQRLQFHLETIRRLAQKYPVRVYISGSICGCVKHADDCERRYAISVWSTRVPLVAIGWDWRGGRPVELTLSGVSENDNEVKAVLDPIENLYLPGQDPLSCHENADRWETYWRRFLGAVLQLTDIHDRQARAAEAPLQASLFIG